MIQFMWAWVNNPIALAAGFIYQLRCCGKEGSWKRKLLPVILYAVAMAGCLAEGFLLAGDETGISAALTVCLLTLVHLLVAESAWLVHLVIRAIKKRKKAKKTEM